MQSKPSIVCHRTSTSIPTCPRRSYASSVNASIDTCRRLTMKERPRLIFPDFPKRPDYVLPVGLGCSSSHVTRGVEFESNKAKSVGNSNLAAIQHLLGCSLFDTVEGVMVNDHQIQGREIRGSLKLQKCIGFEKGTISQAGQNSARRR